MKAKNGPSSISNKESGTLLVPSTCYLRLIVVYVAIFPEGEIPESFLRGAGLDNTFISMVLE
jgi:hypothetical protein